MAIRLLWGTYLMEIFIENMLQLRLFSVYFKIISIYKKFLFAYRNNDIIAARVIYGICSLEKNFLNCGFWCIFWSDFVLKLF